MSDWNPDKIKKLRATLGQSQNQFALNFYLTVDAIRCWEHGVNVPSGPSLVILDRLAGEAETSRKKYEPTTQQGAVGSDEMEEIMRLRNWNRIQLAGAMGLSLNMIHQTMSGRRNIGKVSQRLLKTMLASAKRAARKTKRPRAGAPARGDKK